MEWVKIERNLVQQMLYGPLNSELPFSNYRKIEKPGWRENLSFKVALVLGIWFFAIWQFVNIFASGSLNLPWKGWISPLALVLELILLILISLVIFRGFSLKGQVTKLAFARQELTFSDNHSVFNQYLDEIVYFFSVKKYNLVILEDLDRAGNLNIFEHLRELNQILNNSELIKQSFDKEVELPIRFLYAVKEDLFVEPVSNKNDETNHFKSDDQSPVLKINSSREDRFEVAEITTKFFDWTLTLVPLVSFDNAADFLMKSFESPKDEFKDYLRGVGIFFNHVRVLENAVNDFKLQLQIHKENDLDVKQLFTLILFKNGFPDEYQKFLNREGGLNDVLHNRKLRTERVKDLESEQSRLSKKRQSLYGLTEQFIVTYYLGIFLKEGISTNSVLTSQDDAVDTGPIIDIDFKTLQKFYVYIRENHQNIIVRDGFHYQNTFDPDLLVVSNLLFNSDAVFSTTSLTERIEKIDNKLLNLGVQLEEVKTCPLFKIAKENPMEISCILQDTGKAQEFLTFSVMNGYLDETIDDYLTLFTGERISINDRGLVRLIRGGKKVEFRSRIDNIQSFIGDLIDSDYDMPGMLLEELIKRDYIDDKLSKEEEKTREFRAAVDQLVGTDDISFKEDLRTLLDFDDLNQEPKLNQHEKYDLVKELSQRLNYSWKRYTGISEIAPMLLAATDTSEISDLLTETPSLVEYINNNKWDELGETAEKEKSKVVKILERKDIHLSRLNIKSQKNKKFTTMLIINRAVELNDQTTETILASFAEPNQKLSYAIALEEKNRLLKEFINIFSNDFVKSEIQLNLVTNETAESILTLLCLPNLKVNLISELLIQYPRKDLELSLLESKGLDKEKMLIVIKAIIENEAAELSWNNLDYLLSNKQEDEGVDYLDQFIKISENLSKLPIPMTHSEREVLRSLVNNYPIVADYQNKEILSAVNNYDVQNQEGETLNNLIQWDLVELDEKLLKRSLSDSQLQILAENHLNDTKGDWTELGDTLFNRLPLKSYIYFIQHNDGLSALSLSAIIELSSDFLNDTKFTDIQKEQVFNSYVGIKPIEDANLLYSSSIAITQIFGSISDERKKVELLSRNIEKNSETLTETEIVELLTEISDGEVENIRDLEQNQIHITNNKRNNELAKGLEQKGLLQSVRTISKDKELSFKRTNKMNRIIKEVLNNEL